MEFKFIDVERAANILGVTTRTITKMIIVGRINAEAEYGGGGRGGISYRIPLDALPAEAQARYWMEESARGAEAGNADMSAYREVYGEEGLRELLRMQAARRRSRHTD